MGKSKDLNTLVQELKHLTTDRELFLEKSNEWYKPVYIRDPGTRHHAYGCTIHRPKALMKEYIKGLIDGIIYQKGRSITGHII